MQILYLKCFAVVLFFNLCFMFVYKVHFVSLHNMQHWLLLYFFTESFVCETGVYVYIPHVFLFWYNSFLFLGSFKFNLSWPVVPITCSCINRSFRSINTTFSKSQTRKTLIQAIKVQFLNLGIWIAWKLPIEAKTRLRIRSIHFTDKLGQRAVDGLYESCIHITSKW